LRAGARSLCDCAYQNVVDRSPVSSRQAAKLEALLRSEPSFLLLGQDDDGTIHFSVRARFVQERLRDPARAASIRPRLIWGVPTKRGRIGFGAGARPRRELRLPAGAPWPSQPVDIPEGWRAAKVPTRIRATGCYAFQVDGRGFSYVLTFAVLQSL
jgi:hypothetical protein